MREPPHRYWGWRLPGTRKVYASEGSAYYAIAKALVVAKYPADLGRYSPAEIEEMYEIPERWVAVRRAKSDALFCREWSESGDYILHFDTKRWAAFVWRVARFLRFVDARRSDEQRLRALTPAELDIEFQATEKLSTDAANRLPLIARIAKERQGG